MLRLDVNAYVKSLLARDEIEEGEGLRLFTGEITAHEAGLAKILETVPTTQVVGPFRVNTSHVREFLVAKYDTLIERCKQLVADVPKRVCAGSTGGTRSLAKLVNAGGGSGVGQGCSRPRGDDPADVQPAEGGAERGVPVYWTRSRRMRAPSDEDSRSCWRRRSSSRGSARGHRQAGRGAERGAHAQVPGGPGGGAGRLLEPRASSPSACRSSEVVTDIQDGGDREAVEEMTRI